VARRLPGSRAQVLVEPPVRRPPRLGLRFAQALAEIFPQKRMGVERDETPEPYSRCTASSFADSSALRLEFQSSSANPTSGSVSPAMAGALSKGDAIAGGGPVETSP